MSEQNEHEEKEPWQIEILNDEAFERLKGHARRHSDKRMEDDPDERCNCNRCLRMEQVRKTIDALEGKEEEQRFFCSILSHAGKMKEAMRNAYMMSNGVQAMLKGEGEMISVPKSLIDDLGLDNDAQRPPQDGDSFAG